MMNNFFNFLKSLPAVFVQAANAIAALANEYTIGGGRKIVRSSVNAYAKYISQSLPNMEVLIIGLIKDIVCSPELPAVVKAVKESSDRIIKTLEELKDDPEIKANVEIIKGIIRSWNPPDEDFNKVLRSEPIFDLKDVESISSDKFEKMYAERKESDNKHQIKRIWQKKIDKVKNDF